MTIEFHTPNCKVSEKLINNTRNKMLKLSHINKEVSRAEIILKEDETFIPAENKVCEIRLTVYGNDLLARARTDDFETSAKEVVRKLNKMVKQQVKKQNEPPDELTSTVKA